ncbi:MAG: Holliday junction branch migration protein RuvA [Myxococcota bacterium]
MIGFLQGRIQRLDPQGAVVVTGGVGYLLQLPLSDIARLGEQGREVALHVHTHVREDAIVLYGFLRPESLRMFRALIQVNGVGPRVALAVLSHLDANRLRQAVAGGDAQALLGAPGVGKKTAQRIVLELRDRLEPLAENLPPLPTGATGTAAELRSAIANLGYRPNQVEGAIAAVEDLAKSGASLDTLIAKALQHLTAK